MPRADQSWDWVIPKYRDLVAGRFVELAPLLRVAEQIARTPQAASLRAGMSMATLLISATDEPLSQESEPFISVMIEPDGKLLRVQYFKEAGGPVLFSRVCEEAEAQAALRPLFLRLWNETSKRMGSGSGE